MILHHSVDKKSANELSLYHWAGAWCKRRRIIERERTVGARPYNMPPCSDDDLLPFIILLRASNDALTSLVE